MVKDQTLTENINIFDLLGKSFVLYKKHYTHLLSLGLIYAILGELGLRLLTLVESNFTGVTIVIETIFTAWASIALIYFCSRVVQKKNVTLTQALEVPKKIFFQYLAVTLSVIMVIAIGIMFLVIPGIYFSVIFIFADLLVVLENSRYREAFLKSAALVKEDFWKILQFNLVFAAILILPSLLLYPFSEAQPALVNILTKIFLVFVIPFYALAQVSLYYKIKRLRPLPEPFE